MKEESKKINIGVKQQEIDFQGCCLKEWKMDPGSTEFRRPAEAEKLPQETLGAISDLWDFEITNLVLL